MVIRHITFAFALATLTCISTDIFAGKKRRIQNARQDKNSRGRNQTRKGFRKKRGQGDAHRQAARLEKKGYKPKVGRQHNAAAVNAVLQFLNR